MCRHEFVVADITALLEMHSLKLMKNSILNRVVHYNNIIYIFDTQVDSYAQIQYTDVLYYTTTTPQGCNYYYIKNQISYARVTLQSSSQTDAPCVNLIAYDEAESGAHVGVVTSVFSDTQAPIKRNINNCLHKSYVTIFNRKQA